MDAGRGSTTAIFPMPQIPELLFPPPPPPPLPANSYSLYSSAASSRHAPTITSFPVLVLTVLGVLTTSVLLLAYYVFVIRCCLKWHRTNTTSDDRTAARIRRRNASSSSATTTTGLPAVSSGAAAAAEARGLEEAVIRALPAFSYRKAVIKSAAAAAADDPAGECAVCLGEFEEEERVRMLPACLHVFHVDCIDTWLHGNANCPLCRTAIITAHCCLLPIPPMDQLPRHDEVAIHIQAVVPVTTEEHEHEQASTAMASAGDAATDEQVSSDKRMSRDASCWHGIDISSNADDCTVERKDRDVLPLPLRRSFSMGSMAAGSEVYLQIHSILQRNSAHFHGDDGDSSTSSSSSV
ncbi:hypothetical protein HU200_002574 [Digitaria exilis]|uniref:RING-type E3 ubiquitin transferase n=1 Tax=Digitaria exilis TaxID=1010633 RepID=A0A835KWP3_9POAL|nr:hypothetical protein HU200_002574 [Digitaria exilis]